MQPYQPYLGDTRALPEHDHRLLRNWFFHPFDAYRSAKNSHVIEINPRLLTSWIAHPAKAFFAWKIQRTINSQKGVDFVVQKLCDMGFSLDKDLSTDTRHVFTHPDHEAVIEFSVRESC
jgi:hypothetical protein